MKSSKDVKISFRMTAEEKEIIQSYCEKHKCTISSFIRFACAEIYKKENQ